MTQDRDSGARAVDYGLTTAALLASRLGYKKIRNPNSNEYEKDGKVVVIKCARIKTPSIGVSYKMLNRISSILACLENCDGKYECYELSLDVFRSIMSPTRSKGPSADKVGIAKKTDIISKVKLLHLIDLEE